MPEEVEFKDKPDFKDLLSALDKAFQPYRPIRIREFFIGRYALLQRCQEAIERSGSHIALYGDRGVGKTSLANIVRTLHSNNSIGTHDQNQKTFYDSCDSADTYQSVWRKLLNGYMSRILFPPDEEEGEEEFEKTVYIFQEAEVEFGTSEVLKALRSIGGVPLIILDEFDRLPKEFNMRLFADTIKVISDNIPSATIMIVGVAENIKELIGEHPSVERHLIQIKLPVMPKAELEQIIRKGLEELGMTMDEDVIENILMLSCGYPYYTHLLSYHVCRNALLAETLNVNDSDFKKAIIAAVDQSQESLRRAYQDATLSNKVNNYKEVLWAIAKVEVDEYGTFQASDLLPFLREVLGNEIKIGNYISSLNEFCEEDRGGILHKLGREGDYRYKISNSLMRPFLLLKYHSNQKPSR